MHDILEGLNEAQKNAVITTEGPVMAIAGAGSGKTNVLTRRIAHLIFNLGIPKEQILAITFTNKAANEMKSRLAGLLGFSYMNTRDMWVSTFHSMCSRILRQHIDRLGYQTTFQIIDDDDVTQLIKAIAKEAGIDVKLIPPKQLKTYILNIKADESLLDDLKESPLKDALIKVYPLYQKRLKENNLVDFEDLMILTIRLLEKHEDIKAFYQGQFQYILVDEFQDTNNLQYRLIKLLTNKKQNVFIVGDEDQSIYAFRGANIENIRKFKREYKNPAIILLEQNYRSTNTILNAANQIISQNKNRIEKNLFSKRGDGKPITLFKGYNHRDEVDFVAETIKELSRHGYSYDDIAVLYRTNNMSRVFEDVFMRRKLPYKIIGNMSFFKRKEIKDMVAYLRLIINPHDDYSMSRVINEPRRGIGAKTMERLHDFSQSYDLSYYEAIDADRLPLGNGPVKKLKAFKCLIKNLIKTLEQANFNTLIDDLLNESGYKAMLEHDDMGDVRFENILELKTMFKENEQLMEAADQKTLLMYILEDIALKSQEDEETEEKSVTLMTLHSAKGLEFPVVFIVGVEQGLFPLHRSMENPKELAEERRLMYVGITRAMDRLYFTNAKERQHYGEYVNNPDSMFIKDISDDLMQFEGLARQARLDEKRYKQDALRKKSYLERQHALSDGNVNDLDKGDKVTHKVFGEGVVVSVAKNLCTIAFNKDHGIKTLMKDHPALKKVKR